jgi:hypothetical protein
LETIYKLSKALDTDLICFPEYKYSSSILGTYGKIIVTPISKTFVRTVTIKDYVRGKEMDQWIIKGGKNVQGSLVSKIKINQVA